MIDSMLSNQVSFLILPPPKIVRPLIISFLLYLLESLLTNSLLFLNEPKIGRICVSTYIFGGTRIVQPPKIINKLITFLQFETLHKLLAYFSQSKFV